MKTTSITTFAAGVLLLIALAIPGTAHANAFFIQEMSGSGMAQGAAVVAGAGRPSSMFQNAANLSFLDGMYLELTGTAYMPDGYYQNPQGERTNLVSDPIFTPAMFFSYRINDWLAVGLGEFTDFGLAIKWPKGWEGSHLVEEAGMTSFTINPNISFGPFEGFAVAVGFNAKWGQVSIKRRMTLGMPAAGSENSPDRVHLAGAAWGFGANFGLMYQPLEWMRIGFAYRSAIEMRLSDGKADFDVHPSFANNFPDQRFKSTIVLPHLISGGVRFWPHESFSIELDVWGTLWSSYDKLTFEFDKGLKTAPNAVTKTQTEYKKFRDFIQVRLGMEWWPHEYVALRAGTMLDGGVIPDETLDPMLPDNHRINTSVGVGVDYKGFFVDAAYMLVYMLPRDVSNVTDNPLPGKYVFLVHDVTLSIGYHHDFAK